ncbi:hypothetical protein, partial [Metabacillus sp. JX24]|uniref:hypothetical protein n=1 Tax=Metabacillus sp. JX24 TaxID=3240759 RepID=UPI00350FC418
MNRVCGGRLIYSEKKRIVFIVCTRSFPLQSLAFRGERREPPDMNETVKVPPAHRFLNVFNKRS